MDEGEEGEGEGELVSSEDGTSKESKLSPTA